MIIVCPACAIKYTVEASAIPFAGRKVECSRCGWIWHAGGPGGNVDSGSAPAAAGLVTRLESSRTPGMLTENTGSLAAPRFAMSADYSLGLGQTATGGAEAKSAAPGGVAQAAFPRWGEENDGEIAEDRRAGDAPQPRLSFEIPSAKREEPDDSPHLGEKGTAGSPPPLPAQDDGRHVRLDERRSGASGLGWMAGSVIIALLLAGGFIYQAEILAWIKSLELILPANF